MKRTLLTFITLVLAQLIVAQGFVRTVDQNLPTTYQWYMAEFNSGVPNVIGEAIPLYAPEGVDHIIIKKWSMDSYFGESIKSSDDPTVVVDAEYVDGRLASYTERGSSIKTVFSYDENGIIVKCCSYNSTDGATIKDMSDTYRHYKSIGTLMVEAEEGAPSEGYYYDYSGRGDRCKFVGTGPKQDDYSIDYLQARTTPTAVSFSIKRLLVSKGKLAMRYGVFGWRKIMKMRGVEKAQKCYTYYCESPQNCEMTSPYTTRNMTLNEAGMRTSRSAQSCFAEGWQNDEYIIEYILTE